MLGFSLQNFPGEKVKKRLFLPLFYVPNERVALNMLTVKKAPEY